MNLPGKLTIGQMFRFWLPLALTWQMMAIEGPLITAIIGRLPDEKYNLAAFGVAFSWSLLIESPVISLLSASAALCVDLDSFKKIRNFSWILISITTLAMIVLIIPAVFHMVAYDLLNLPEKVATLAYNATLFMIPWPGTIGYRRFYQGTLIRHGMPRKVAQGTIVRVICMTACGLSLYFWSSLSGASIGTATLVAGVSGEAIAARFMARGVVRKIYEAGTIPVSQRPPLTYSELVHFYTPLMMTIFLGMGTQPLITFAVGHSRLPLDSLAVLPVTNSLIWFVLTSAVGLQEAVIVLVGDNFENMAVVRKFSFSLGALLSLLLAFLAFTPLGSFLLLAVWGLPSELTGLAGVVLHLAILAPLLRAWEGMQRAIIVKSKLTRLVTIATLLEIGVIGGVLYALIKQFNFIGALASPLATQSGVVVAIAFMIPCINGFIRQSQRPTSISP